VAESPSDSSGPDARILAFAGSTRTQSFNKKLIRIAVAGARAAGADVTLIDLRDRPLPLYDGDLEAESGLPENARRLRELFLAHRGLLIAAPEYNHSISAVLKNAIDWLSRPVPGAPPLDAFRGKIAGLVAASPGMFGGMRGLVHVRQILTGLGVLVIPEQRTIPRAREAFGADGALIDPDSQAAVERVGARLAEVLRRLAPS
jgi:NAD(P)H-dependent FMN reductase